VKIRRPIFGALAAALALVVATSGCSQKYKEYRRDAPVASRNDKPADVFTMPDGFSNFAAKCDGPNRVYVAFHGDDNYAAIAVVANDPRCTTPAR
jgi:hypothetical protein